MDEARTTGLIDGRTRRAIFHDLKRRDEFDEELLRDAPPDEPVGPDFPRKQITQKAAEVKNPLRNAFFFISRSIKLDNLAKMLHLTKERRNI